MTEPAPTYLGIDWGTSNRRAYVLNARGELVRRHEDGAGILNVGGDFSASLRVLLQQLGIEQAEVVMSGMVGSRNGWQEAPYLSTDHPLSQLPRALMDVEAGMPRVRCRIVPGFRFLDAAGLPDVMRGEETQVLGALQLIEQRMQHAGASGDSSDWFLLPGTHSKWVHVVNGRIVQLMTFMTGELFSLLSQHGTLAKVMTGEQQVPDAFSAGLDAARYGGFTHTAFCCRALVVTDRMPAAHAASFLSGLLIGTELHEVGRVNQGEPATPIQVIGSPALSERYLHALKLLGIPSCAWQPDHIYVAALRALFNIGK